MTLKARPGRTLGDTRQPDRGNRREQAPGVSDHHRRLMPKACGVAAIVVALAGVLNWTWGAWPDILIDFGRELYVPWRMSQGQRLYADIAFFNGPLSQHVNALVFKLFGASFLALVIWNIVVLAGIVALLHWAIRQVSSWWTATASCLVFVLLFACGQYNTTGNNNYITPYSHEIVHGLALSILSLVLLWRVPRRGLPMAALSGAALGLVFLTKTEVFLAAAVASAVTLALTLWRLRPSRGRLMAMSGTFLAGAIAPPLIALAAMSAIMPAATALKGLMGSLPYLFDSPVTGNAFYSRLMGTDDIRGNLLALAKCALCGLLCLVPPAALALVCDRASRKHRLLAIGLGVLVCWVLWHGREWIGRAMFFDVGRPLPLVLLIAGGVLLTAMVRARKNPPLLERRIRQFSLVVLAVMLLPKILLAVRIAHYGFALAMPASLLVVVMLVEWIPHWIDRAGGHGIVFVGPAIGIIAAVVMVHLDLESVLLAAKNEPVQVPGGFIRTDESRGKMVNEIVRRLRATVKPGQTLAVCLEGVTINYISQLRNPTPYVNFMDIVIFGQKDVVDGFRSHPPDLVVWVPRDVSEQGYRRFGPDPGDFGPDLYNWIVRNYRPVWAIRGSRTTASGGTGYAWTVEEDLDKWQPQTHGNQEAVLLERVSK